MKNASPFLSMAVVAALGATGCTTVRQVGMVNMISTRNVDPNLQYKQLSTYSGGSSSELKDSQARTVDDAVNQTVRRVPGGEFLMNVKLYLVDEKYFAVEGDVWGSDDPSYRGFRAGDRVTFKNPALFNFNGPKFLSGTIVGLKSEQVCLVRPDNQPDSTMEVSYDDLTKSNEPAPPPVAAPPGPAATPAPTPPPPATTP